MHKQIMKIWGRTLKLDVIFDCYEDETITELQKTALEAFVNSIDNVNIVLPIVEKYCIEDEAMEDERIDNIFRYVAPTGIFIVRSNMYRKVALLCDYRFDVEHGLALVFVNEKFKEIVSQEEI